MFRERTYIKNPKRTIYQVIRILTLLEDSVVSPDAKLILGSVTKTLLRMADQGYLRVEHYINANIIRRYQQGAHVVSILSEFEISKSHLYRVLEAEGIPLRHGRK